MSSQTRRGAVENGTDWSLMPSYPSLLLPNANTYP